ncbi:MAG TPA: class I tRNA ligase family protein, partial [Terriglobales bacterium]|nr:class I tRNA ligase family protein [Terriglobales bacterium]
ITAYEILFFWVARMIMFGCHFMADHHQDAAIKKASGWAKRGDDSVPFREVYIHALVSDAERQKMSKTKGNVIDPLEIIERFGTDATRFTLAAMAAPGTDIAFNESRTEGYRAFANKIWNAARFMFMYVDRAQQAGVWFLDQFRKQSGRTAPTEGLSGFQVQTLEDRWILSRFNRVAKDVGDSLETYRFHEAANRVYDFFWGEFCDWYIELVKPRLTQETASAETVRVACKNLVILFEGALRLLSPFMPFITEEIWQAIYDGRPETKSIALTPYPLPSAAQINTEAESEMAVLQDLIVSIRNLRAELKVDPPRLAVPVEIHASPDVRKLIEQNRAAVERLATVEKINFVANSLAKLPGVRSTSRFEVRVLYEKKIDVEAERQRLTKELERMEKEIGNAQRQLGNEQFLAKAPAKVVDGLRHRSQELATLIEKTRIALSELNGHGM